MRKTLLILTLFYCTLVAIAQPPKTFNFQSVITDKSNTVVTNQLISLQFSILENYDSKDPLYQETHTIHTNGYGIVNLKIGDGDITSGDFKTIDWGKDNYYIEIAADFSGGSNYSLIANKLLLSAPMSQLSDRTKFAANINYDNLANKPQIFITEEQSFKLNLITVTDSINLDSIQNQVNKNLFAELIEFPGFGTTVGTAYTIYWAEINDEVFYEKGGLGVNSEIGSDLNGATLKVTGGILNNGIAEETTPGLIYFDPDTLREYATGGFYYYDKKHEKQTFNIEHPFLYQMYFIDSTQNVPDQVILDDMIQIGRMGIGSTIEAGIDFQENEIVLADSIIIIKFQDTSNTSSFPSSDWTIEVNDPNNVDGDYFAFSEVTTGRTPFKISSNNKDIHILENGNVGIGINNPVNKLELLGTVKDTLIGDASLLTNVPGSGTASAQNTGSTTIEADNDNNSTGAIIFQTQKTNKMVIASNGNIAIGKPISENKLDVAGDFSAENIDVQKLMQTSKSLIHNVSLITDIELDASANEINVKNKDVIKIQTSGSVVNPYFSNMEKGQKLIIINAGSNIVVVSGAPILYSANSATVIYDGTTWICVDFVD